jgi:hypothetical protein
MIICDDWLAFLCWAKHIMKKGEACGIIMGELNQSWIWHHGISPPTHDRNWWPILWDLSSKNIKGFHYYYKMELDDLNNMFTKFNIKWFSLLPFMKIIDLLKETICETSSWALTRVMWLSILLWTYKWKIAKARIFDINQRTNKLSGISNRFISMVQGLTQLWQW